MTTTYVVDIIINGTGGELDRVVVEDDGDESINRALVALLKRTPLRAGDTIQIVSR